MKGVYKNRPKFGKPYPYIYIKIHQNLKIHPNLVGVCGSGGGGDMAPQVTCNFVHAMVINVDNMDRITKKEWSE